MQGGCLSREERSCGAALATASCAPAEPKERSPRREKILLSVSSDNISLYNPGWGGSQGFLLCVLCEVCLCVCCASLNIELCKVECLTMHYVKLNVIHPPGKPAFGRLLHLLPSAESPRRGHGGPSWGGGEARGGGDRCQDRVRQGKTTSREPWRSPGSCRTSPA